MDMTIYYAPQWNGPMTPSSPIEREAGRQTDWQEAMTIAWRNHHPTPLLSTGMAEHKVAKHTTAAAGGKWKSWVLGQRGGALIEFIFPPIRAPYVTT